MPPVHTRQIHTCNDAQLLREVEESLEEMLKSATVDFLRFNDDIAANTMVQCTRMTWPKVEFGRLGWVSCTLGPVVNCVVVMMEGGWYG